MTKRIAIELLLLVLLGLMVGIAPLWAQYKTDVKHITNQLKKLAPVTILYDESILSPEEKQVIAKLVDNRLIRKSLFLPRIVEIIAKEEGA